MNTATKLILGGVLLGAVVFGGRLLVDKQSLASESVESKTAEGEMTALLLTERQAIVYKEPNCGCCNGYIAELEKQGFSVEVKSQDTAPVKERYGIATDKQSCHTMVIGGYFVEGHVPLVAVEKLLSERPEIDGIGLPGMPTGTPGMPGMKQAPYEIYQKKGNNFSQFMTL